MPRTTRGRAGAGPIMTVALGCVLATAVMAGAAAPALASTTTTTHPSQPGTADVAYAGSLLTVNEQSVGPAFQRDHRLRLHGTGLGIPCGRTGDHRGHHHPRGVRERRRGADQADRAEIHDVVRQLRRQPNRRRRTTPRASTPRKFKAIAAGKARASSLFTFMATPGIPARADGSRDRPSRAGVRLHDAIGAQRSWAFRRAPISSLLGRYRRRPELPDLR